MKVVINLIAALSLAAFAATSAYAQDAKKEDKDKAATTSQDKDKAKAATNGKDKDKAGAGATTKPEEKKESK